MAIEKELLDQLLEGRDPETVFTQDGLLDELKKGLSERVLNAELDAHLDAETADGKTNRHNGRSQKTVLTGTSKVTLDIPRDRAGTFDPQLIAKYQRRFPDFDEKIISEQTEGAKFWLRVMNELKNRGVQDILLAVVDGLKGFPEAINATFPETVVQSQGRRCRPGGAGCLRGRPLGREISGHRTELAAQLGTPLALLCLPRGGTQDCLHHKRHRVAQRQDPARCPHPRPLPQ